MRRCLLMPCGVLTGRVRLGRGSPPRSPAALVSAVAVISAAVCLLAAGCGSRAEQYAREARSSYVSARAVLAEVKSFPSEMEELLRREELAGLKERARSLIDDVGRRISAASAAFGTVEEKLALLRGEGNGEFAAYADKLEVLVGMNREILNAFTEFAGLSASVLEGLPYRQNPQNLMPALQRMGQVIQRVQELASEVEAAEAEAEEVYRKLAS